MESEITSLTDAATKLSPLERAQLVESILQSLDAAAPGLDEKWAAEAHDRVAAFRRGDLPAHDFDDVLELWRTSASAR